MAKDQAIPRRNKMFWHYARDDFMFTTIRVISKHQDTQVYSAILPQHLTNQAMLESKAYITYHAYATGEKTLKPKSTKKKVDSESSLKTKLTQASKGKKNQDDERQVKIEGTGSIPGVPDVSTYESDDEQISWKSSEEEDDDEVNMNDANQDDDDEQTDSDNDGDDFVHPKLSTHDDEARQDDEVNEEESDDESNEDSDEEVQGANIEEEATHEEDEANELYRDANINLEGRDTVMTDAPLPNVQRTQVTEDTHVIITTLINSEGQ
ncbi:hypothetical protein Tco_0505511 [Tanacetum coccineum]